MKRFLTFLFSFGIILLIGLSVDSHRLPKQIKKELAHAGKDATSTADSGPKQPTQDVANKDTKSAKDNTNTDPNKDSTAVKTGNSQSSQTDSTKQKVKGKNLLLFYLI